MKIYTIYLLLHILVVKQVCEALIVFPSRIQDVQSKHSDQPIASLLNNDQANSQDTWKNYLEFSASEQNYTGILFFSVEKKVDIASGNFIVNLRSAEHSKQGVAFDILLNSKGGSTAEWVEIGNDAANTKGFPYWTTSNFVFPTTLDLSRVQDANNIVQVRVRSLKPYNDFQLDYVQLNVNERTLQKRAQHQQQSNSRTSAFNLRILILGTSKLDHGAKFAQLVFNSVGMTYDFVMVSDDTDLSEYLLQHTSKYSGIIVTSRDLLNADQQSAVTQYQIDVGVKLVVFGSTPVGLPGLYSEDTTSDKGFLTIAQEFVPYTLSMKTTAIVDSESSKGYSGLDAANVSLASIADPSSARPAIIFTGSDGNPLVAAAVCKFEDGTEQLHYFITQDQRYKHSLVFAPLLLNWISPGGIFLGSRRLTLSIQPDDLFLASNLWDVKKHTSSQTLTYRMNPTDLQALATYVARKTEQLPAGSYITIEWPFNGAGTTWYTQPDALFQKAIQLQRAFWFVSHTWSHPCNFDNATYANVYEELKKNIEFTPTFLTNGLRSSRFSKQCLVTPCITGLFNRRALKAMYDSGIVNVVGDNSVPQLKPKNPYIGTYTSVKNNGFKGLFIIPREVLDIDYDNSLASEFVDQWNTENKMKETFEQAMVRQTDIGLYNMLAYRQDPIMFHQANARYFRYKEHGREDSTTGSLISIWMDGVLNQLMSYSVLPVVSPKYEDLAEMWRERHAREHCGITARLRLSKSRQVTNILIRSDRDCVAQISGVTLAEGGTVVMETYGPEMTAYVTMTAGVQQTLTLVSHVSV